MGCPPLGAGKTTGAVLILRIHELRSVIGNKAAAPNIERTTERIGQDSRSNAKIVVTYTGGYNRRVSSRNVS